MMNHSIRIHGFAHSVPRLPGSIQEDVPAMMEFDLTNGEIKANISHLHVGFV